MPIAISTRAQAYAKVKAWSPLDNIKVMDDIGDSGLSREAPSSAELAPRRRRRYPHVLVRAALDDPAVEFW